MADEEMLETGDETVEQPTIDEGAEGAEFVPEASTKPKNDIYTLLLIVGFVAFLTGCILGGNELYDFYDVTFWVLSKK